MATRLTSNPPQGVMDGGKWGSVKYAGEATNVMCLILCLIGGFFTCCGACAFLCPLDKKDAYLLGNMVYDHNGRLLGTAGHVNFAMNPMWRPHAIPTETATATPTATAIVVANPVAPCYTCHPLEATLPIVEAKAEIIR